jgi:hypothetical protein
MAKSKSSYFGGPSGPNLGPNPPLPKKAFPYNERDIDYRLVISEADKSEENFRRIKNLVYNYERIGRQQLTYVREDILKKFNLANGIIDHSDYIKGETEYNTEIDFLGGESLEFDIKFYPIIPNIINTIVNFLGKIKINYSAIAVNREAQNEILDQKNEQIRNLLITKAKAIFDSHLQEQGITEETQPDVYNQQLQIFQALPQIQKYYSTDFRLEVEEWANHKLVTDKHRFNIPDLEKKLLFNKITVDRPFFHINLLDESYKPEVLRPENCFWLRSPYVDDVSEGVMFGWYEYDSAVNLINRFGSRLVEEDIAKLQRFYLSTRFTQYTSEKYNTNIPDDLAQAQNYIAFRTEFRDKGDSKHRGEEYKEHLIEVMNMYLQIPRKLYKLTMKSTPMFEGQESEIVSTIVDETYKVSMKPVYEQGKPKTVDYLIYGEHLEPFYINELWRCIKINLTRNPNPDLGQDIWVFLDKYPVQIANPKISRFGSLIPVHGGPETNEYSISSTIVDKCKPWQVFYNYLWNRNNQILQGELGVFLMMNQNSIPSESMGEEWGRNNLIKWAMAARDVGIGPMDTSLANTGSPNLQATGGFGQKIDMTRTEEVIQKAKLAEICKNECLAIVGVSPQLMADISPNETATGITQGIQRSITQLKHIYDAHFKMMESGRQTMLEIAKYISIKTGQADESYMNDEGERVIFQGDTANYPLYQLGVFVTSDFDDSLLQEEIRQKAMRDNTMEPLDSLAVMNSHSIGETYTKLKELQEKRDKQVEEQQKQQMQMEQAKIEARQRELDQKLEWDAQQRELDRQNEVKIAQIKVVGQSQFSEGGGVDELVKLQAAQLKQDQYYQSIIDAAQAKRLKQDELAHSKSKDQAQLNQDKDLEQQKIDLEREKNLTRLKISQDQLKIAKVNK